MLYVIKSMYFQLEFSIPDSWKGQQVWLRWNSQAEAMLWSMNGEPLQVSWPLDPSMNRSLN